MTALFPAARSSILHRQWGGVREETAERREWKSMKSWARRGRWRLVGTILAMAVARRGPARRNYQPYVVGERAAGSGRRR
jgi:hypothetical protein